MLDDTQFDRLIALLATLDNLEDALEALPSHDVFVVAENQPYPVP